MVQAQRDVVEHVLPDVGDSVALERQTLKDRQHATESKPIGREIFKQVAGQVDVGRVRVVRLRQLCEPEVDAQQLAVLILV